MKKLFDMLSEPKWLAQGVGFMVLTAIAAVYFFSYVPGQRDYFAKLNFRVLALRCEQIRMALEALPGALKIAARSVESNEDRRDSEGDRLKRLRSAMELIPTLTLTEPPAIEATKGSTSSVSITISQETGGHWIEFSYRGYAGTNTERFVTLRARGDFNRLVGAPAEFDGMLIAEEQSGAVMFQRLPVGVTLQKLNLTTGTGVDVLGSNLVKRATTLASVPIAGDNYKLFVQPLHIAVPMMQGGAKDWLVCGLVRSSRFEQESLEMPYIYLVIFIFLVLFSTLSLAFPQVAFARPRDPLRRRHVILLLAGMLGGAALLTVLLLIVFVYPLMEMRMDRRPEPLATMLCDNFKAEVEELHRLLEEFDGLRRTRSKESPSSVVELLKQREIAGINTNAKARFDMVFWIGANGVQTAKWAARGVVSALNPVGWRSYFRDALNDRATQYAWRVDGANRFWLEPIYSISSGENSVVLSIRNVSGEVAAIESRLQSLIRPVLPTGYGYCVVAPDGQVLFHSDDRRNLRENIFEECDEPLQLRSAIVSRASKELEGSYLGRRHCFYVKPIPNLTWSLVVFRDKQSLNAAIFEVVLVNLSLVALYFLLPTVAVLLLRSLPWLVGRAAGCPTRLSLLPRWLWPDIRNRKEYWFLAVFNYFFAALSVSVFSIWLRSSAWTAVWAGTVVLAGAITSAWLLASTRSSPFLDRWYERLLRLARGVLKGSPSAEVDRRVFLWGYVAALVSLVVLLGVTPAFACFRIALDQRVKLFVKHNQFRIAKAITERAERIKSDCRAAGVSDDVLAAKLKIEADKLPWDIYAGEELGFKVEDQGGSGMNRKKTPVPNRFNWLFDKVTPLHDPTLVEARGLLADRAEDNGWYWTDNPVNGLEFYVNNYRENHSLRVTTRISELLLGGWFPPVGLLTLATVGVVLLLPVTFFARRVFLVEFGPAKRAVRGTGRPEPSPAQKAPALNTPEEFRAVWEGCSPDERLALFYVAKHGVIHRANPALPGLLGKRLLSKEPALALAGGEDFKEFVLETMAPETVQEIRGTAPGKGWDLVQGPVYVALVAVAFLLFTTQPDVYKIAIGIITGFAAGPPAILKLISLFEGEKERKPDRAA